MGLQPNILRILLVEDSPDDVFFFTHCAARLRVGRIEHAVDGEAAKLHLSSTLQLPAIIVTDLKMPRCDGVELLNWIRSEERLKDIPVIVLSASAGARDQDRAYAAGANAYFTKPSQISEYDALLRSLLSFTRNAEETNNEEASA